MVNIKENLKSILRKTGLLAPARSGIYWSTGFDANTTHPRRLMRRFYAQFIKRGDLCFDIGANLGDRTRMFLELGARVICVEPQKDCLNRLYRLFGRNKNVMIVPKGVASKEGAADLAICNDAPVISTMSERFKKDSIFAKEYGYRWQENERVAVTTLDLLISQYGMPVFCKIDIKGFEKEALKNDGVCHEENWPYVISRFDKKPPKKCYVEGYPFVFGFTVYEDFESAKVKKTGIVNMPKKVEVALGGHAVMAVGYDKTKKRFLVRNSWGKSWGINGYFTMPFEYLETLAEDFWTIRR